MSNVELAAEANQLGVEIAARQGRLAILAGEMDRRMLWGEDGATSMAAWISESHGVSQGTGRAVAKVGEQLWNLPHLAHAFEMGAISLDKVRALIRIATPENDAEMTALAKGCSVHELRDVARAARGATDEDAATQQEGRYLRFNDANRTITARLPEEEYALARATITARARELPTEGRWDQRLHDALLQLLQGALRPKSSPRHLLVAHVDYEHWRQGSGMAELVRGGFVSAEVVRRLRCDTDVVVALDDRLGHTMYEGRARRFPNDAQRREVWRRDRSCRFPGCSNSTFTNVHHVEPWDPVGPTDLPNVVLLCEHHHHRVHERGWKLSGDANGELTIVTPSGRTKTSRPSPLWTD